LAVFYRNQKLETTKCRRSSYPRSNDKQQSRLSALHFHVGPTAFRPAI